MSRRIHEFISVFTFGLTLCVSAQTSDIERGTGLIERGELTDAAKVFHTVISSSASSNLERGIARKNLGTILFRQGRGSDAVQEYDEAEKLLLSELKNDKNARLREEYGKLCYQRANCRLTLLENELANARFNSGTTAFDLMKKYVFPMRKDIKQAQEFYPGQGKADLGLLDAEADIAEARIWISASQTKSAERLYGQALKKLDSALALKDVKADAKKKMLLRKASVVMESQADGKKVYSKIVPILREAIAFQSGNVELDNAAISLFATYALRYSADPEKDFPDMKSSLLAAVETLESLREKNLASADFNARKNYFASRTAVYETLLEYYAAKNDPVSMLCVIESVKNRAIQDAMGVEQRPDGKLIAQVQSALKTKNAMLVSYFLGNANLWVICVTGNSITFRKVADSSDIARKITTVTKACRQPAGRYRVPIAEKEFAMSTANQLFAALLAPEMKFFEKDKLELLYFAPHSVLNYFPIGALVEKYNKEDYEKSLFLAERGIPMLNVPSLRFLTETGVTFTKREKYIFYRSDFSYPPNKGYNPSSKKYDGSYGNLPGTKAEAADIQKALAIPDKNVFAEKNATEENLLNVTGKGATIIHCATHGDLNPDTPLESFLLLAATSREDGKLQVRELLTRYRGQIKCGLFVLSACNTNRGEGNILPGDDIAALSSGILLAGVGNVIATHWEASDETFPKIMTDFYKRQECSSNPAKAMAAAVQAFLKNGKDRDPFYWANIVIQGRN